MFIERKVQSLFPLRRSDLAEVAYSTPETLHSSGALVGEFKAVSINMRLLQSQRDILRSPEGDNF